MFINTKVLIVDDDQDFRLSLSSHLAGLGCFVIPVGTSASFLEALDQQQPTLTIIDKQIGFEDGFDLIHSIRNHKTLSAIPIIVISGQVSSHSKSEAISIGADDFLPKPVNLQDLELRLRANLRRSMSYINEENFVKIEEIRINLRTHCVEIGDNKIDLTMTEYKIFAELALKRDEIVSRDAIALKFLSLKNQNPRTIDVHITSLRRKLNQYGSRIKTIRGRGYMFQTETHR